MPKPVITRAAALAAGLSRYFTGKPCKNGHTAERNTLPGNCVQCITEYHEKEAKLFRRARRQLQAQEG